MSTPVSTRPRTSPRTVAAVLGVAVIAPTVGVLLRLLFGVELNLLFDDIAESSGIPTWYGALNILGVIGWLTGGAVAGFAAWTGLGGPAASRALGWAAALSVLLGLDDLFRFHEHLSNVTGITEALFLGVYLAAAAVWVGRHRHALVPETPLLLLAAAGFAVSLGLDLAQEVGAEGLAGVYVVEEGAKLVGIQCWAAALAVGSRRLVTTG